MPANKTQATDGNVAAFIDAIPEDERRADARAIAAMLREVTGEPPTMWGPSIIGFGSYHYRHDSGREGDMPRLGFSPRKAAHTFYGGFGSQTDLLASLGKHNTGKGCVYIKRLRDIDMGVLKALAATSLAHMDKTHPR